MSDVTIVGSHGPDPHPLDREHAWVVTTLSGGRYELTGVLVEFPEEGVVRFWADGVRIALFNLGAVEAITLDED